MDPKLLETFSKLGIPINEQKRLAGVKDVAYDYVFDSESIATTFKAELAQQGIIFCSISEAVREYPDLVRKHLGSVVRRCLCFLCLLTCTTGCSLIVGSTCSSVESSGYCKSCYIWLIHYQAAAHTRCL